MIGPCLCGDTHCSSCGPAQGNWRCPICRAWADDICDHINEDGTDIRPEFQAQVAALEVDQRAADERLVGDLAEEARLAEDYWNSLEVPR